MTAESRSGKDRIVNINLTNREQEILLLVAQGKMNKRIAYELRIKPGTVRNILLNVVNKLERGGILLSGERGISHTNGGRGTVALAVQRAAEHGLISPLPVEARDRLDFAARSVQSI